MPINSNIFNTVALKIVTERAQDFFTRIIARLNAGNYPTSQPDRQPTPVTSIQDALSVTPGRKEGDAYIADITGNLQKAPFIWAIEYGSPPHSIDARNPPKPMVFYWEKIGKTVAALHVDHPGFEAKPYIQPTIDEHIKNFRSTMKEKYRTEIRSGLVGTEKEFKVVIAI